MACLGDEEEELLVWDVEEEEELELLLPLPLALPAPVTGGSGGEGGGGGGGSKGVTPFSLQWDAFGLGMDSWWSNTKGCTTGFKIRWNPIVPFRAQVFGTIGI